MSVPRFAEKITTYQRANFRCSLLAVFALIAGLAAPPIFAAPVAEVSPLVEMDAGLPKACGFLLSLEGVQVRFLVVRREPGTVLRITVNGLASAPRSVVIADASARSFSRAPDGDAWEAAPDAAGDAALIQRMMVSGVRFAIHIVDGTITIIPGPRPMPQSVRAAYLNCAGDLYRQEN